MKPGYAKFMTRPAFLKQRPCLQSMPMVLGMLKTDKSNPVSLTCNKGLSLLHDPPADNSPVIARGSCHNVVILGLRF